MLIVGTPSTAIIGTLLSGGVAGRLDARELAVGAGLGYLKELAIGLGGS
jgi:hypothetical protein